MHGMDCSVEIEVDGKTYRPQEVPGEHYGRPGELYRENFPLYAIDGELDKYRPETWPPPLAAEEGWFEDPLAPRREDTPITFIAEGPDAREAMSVIRQVMLAPPAPTCLGMYNRTLGEAWGLQKKIERSWGGRASKGEG